MKLLENVNETLVSSYFSSQDVVRDKIHVTNKILIITPVYVIIFVTPCRMCQVRTPTGTRVRPCPPSPMSASGPWSAASPGSR